MNEKPNSHLTLDEQMHLVVRLTGFENPQTPTYQKFIADCSENVTGPSLLRDEFFSGHEVNFLMSLNAHGVLAEKPLIDLGGGKILPYMRAANFAESSRASAYINVDRCHNLTGDHLRKDWQYPLGNIYRDCRNVDGVQLGHLVLIESEQRSSTPTICVADDILDFVARIQPGTANVLVNGIAHEVVGDNRFNRYLADELIRIIRGGAVVVGGATDAFKYVKNAHGIRYTGNDNCGMFHNDDVFERLKAECKANAESIIPDLKVN